MANSLAWYWTHDCVCIIAYELYSAYTQAADLEIKLHTQDCACGFSVCGLHLGLSVRPTINYVLW